MFFFFKQKTAYEMRISDWSSDVCSSDLSNLGQTARRMLRRRVRQLWPDVSGQVVLGLGYPTPLLRAFRSEAERVVAVMPARQGVARWPQDGLSLRSEERRVGKECGSTCRSRV